MNSTERKLYLYKCDKISKKMYGINEMLVIITWGHSVLTSKKEYIIRESDSTGD